MTPVVELSLVLICVTSYAVLAQDKRVLLHSDEDVYQVISSLRADMATLNSSLATLTSSLQAETTLTASLRTEVATLKASLETGESHTFSLQTEVATLKASLQMEATRTSSLQTEVATLQSKITTLETNKIQASQTVGSVYERWGRTSCHGNGTEIVYKGRMAGSKWSETGGAANHLCLPDDPTWGKYVDGMTDFGTIYGTEIEVPDSVANVLFGKLVNNQDVPCAVCRSTRPTHVMIGGRATCYPGWTLEYQGYIVSDFHGNKNNADYVCLDSGLEFASHGSADDDEHTVKIVEVVCGTGGSLPCPPFVNGRELACVVCSK